jgi:hypothetical protein
LAITKWDETHLRGGAALEIFPVRKFIGGELEEQSASAAAPIASMEGIDFQEKYRQRPAFSPPEADKFCTLSFSAAKKKVWEGTDTK